MYAESISLGYMALLVQGGTADITVHEKLEDGKLEELCQATGDACGGTSIDNEFLQLMVDIVGEPLMNSMAKNDPVAYLDLFREFETVKRKIKPLKSAKINFTVPFVALNDLCEKELGKFFPQAVFSCSLKDKISLRGDKLRFDVDVFYALFSKSLENIVSHISRIIKQNKSVSLLLLVGGFSESAILQHTIRKEFPDRRIIIPEDAGLSVLKGAVLFGHNPDYISSRVIRYTYGFKTVEIFNREIHDEAKLVVIDGQERCKDNFWIVKKMNETTSLGTKVKDMIHTIESFQRTVDIPVVVSNKEDPMYTDEPGCMHIGTFTVDIPNPSEDVRCFDVEFHFGNTELTVTATEQDTGHSVTAMFDLV